MTDPSLIKDRLRELNTKAYYLLVALSFLYFRGTDSAAFLLKIAISLTAAAAVPPLQDFFTSERWVNRGSLVQSDMPLARLPVHGFMGLVALCWLWRLINSGLLSSRSVVPPPCPCSHQR